MGCDSSDERSRYVFFNQQLSVTSVFYDRCLDGERCLMTTR